MNMTYKHELNKDKSNRHADVNGVKSQSLNSTRRAKDN